MQAKTDQMFIGQLAAETGVNIETIRYYERVGLPRPAHRGGAGHMTDSTCNG
jgi:DNA-binding transcriptional MerR regulator